jgi:serine/threonine protein kinase
MKMSKSLRYDFNGSTIEIDELTKEGLPFFRKITTSRQEQLCALKLIYKPHPNIVDIYNIGFNCIDMELVNCEYDLTPIVKENIRDIMKDVKKYLNSIGIVYLDWKYDNIGIGKDGKYKLFDFDCSGIINTSKPYIWKEEPEHLFVYNNCIKKNITQPLKMDEYAFSTF